MYFWYDEFDNDVLKSDKFFLHFETCHYQSRDTKNIGEKLPR